MQYRTTCAEIYQTDPKTDLPVKKPISELSPIVPYDNSKNSSNEWELCGCTSNNDWIFWFWRRS